MLFPFVKRWDKYNAAKLKYQDRKKRIFMRGIKIGTKRKDTSASGMGLFEMMKKSETTDKGQPKDARDAQRENQAAEQGL